jgi:putative membrane protein
MSFLVNWLVSAIACAITTFLLPGFVPIGNQFMSIILFSLSVSLVNASVKPIMQTLSLPLTVLTLGIFHFVVNALALMLASWLSINVFGAGVNVTSFMWAIIGSIVLSLVSSIVSGIVGVDD